MFADFLKALVARLTHRRGDPFLQPPEDPFIGSREPRRRGPGGRSSAAAVGEPAEETFVHADAAPRGR